MAYDFPTSPTVGQIITGPNGIQYQWDGVKWLAAGSLGATPFAPAGAINDVGRNLLHNPLFNVAQRGQGFATNGAYTLDRWILNFNLDTGISINQTAAGDTQRTQIGDESATWSMNAAFTGNAGAASFTLMAQRIEDVKRLGNKTVTLSFWAWCASGTLKLGASFDQVFGTGGSPSAAVTNNGQSVTVSTTATRYSMTFTVPSIVGKTMGTNNDHYTTLNFWYSSGTTQAARAGSVGVQSGVIALWGVQLEIGTAATPLEKPDPQQDLAKAQRFYQTGALQMNAYGAAGGAMVVPALLPVQMHHAPTMAVSGTPTYSNASGASFSASTGPGTIYLVFTATAAGMTSCAASFTASADL